MLCEPLPLGAHASTTAGTPVMLHQAPVTQSRTVNHALPDLVNLQISIDHCLPGFKFLLLCAQQVFCPFDEAVRNAGGPLSSAHNTDRQQDIGSSGG